MRYFTRQTFQFLKDLRENNSREWFKDNRARYDDSIKEPAQQFIMAVGARLSEVSEHLRADPRPNGGSLFRIHRDTRFSRDKSPYKTATGIQFRHAKGRDAHAPGLYMHIEPGACFMGVGTWHPEREALRKIRDGIVDDPDGWVSATRAGSFPQVFELWGESLATGPRGFDLEHPLMEDIKRKDFVGMCSVPQSFLTSTSLVDDFLERASAGSPLLAFLCRALDVEW